VGVSVAQGRKPTAAQRSLREFLVLARRDRTLPLLILLTAGAEIVGFSCQPVLREPQCPGVIERFMRTLKEQCLHLHRFQTLGEARRMIATFIARYNHE
jgi:hypothetical protein